MELSVPLITLTFFNDALWQVSLICSHKNERLGNPSFEPLLPIPLSSLPI